MRRLSPSRLACLRGLKIIRACLLDLSKTGVSGLSLDSNLLAFFLFIIVLIILPKMLELNRVMKFYFWCRMGILLNLKNKQKVTGFNIVLGNISTFRYLPDISIYCY